MSKEINTNVTQEELSLAMLEKYTLASCSMDTLTPTSLVKITETMPLIHHAVKATGRSQSQTTFQLMTLNMMAETPLRRLRQIAAEIQKKEDSLHSGYYTAKKAELDIKEKYEDGSERSVLEAQEIESDLLRSRRLIENTYKDIGVLQEAYKDVQESFGIGDDWSEEDFEKEEVIHHSRLAIKQSYRSMMNTGKIDQGNQEYLEQFGIHPQAAFAIIRDYIDNCNLLISEGKMPTSAHLYEFIDAAAEGLLDSGSIEVVKERIGIKSIHREDFSFKALPKK